MEINEIIGEIKQVLENRHCWSTPDMVSYHRGYIMGLLENGLELSIIGSEPQPNVPNFDNGEPMNLAAAAHIARRYLAQPGKYSTATAERIVILLNSFLPVDPVCDLGTPESNTEEIPDNTH